VASTRRNFFILLTKENNLQVCMNFGVYGADMSQNDQHSLGNVKTGDLALIWVPDSKSLYGLFEITSPLFYQDMDIGWDHLWPYRCKFKAWDGWLRTVESKAKLMSFVSKEMTTLTDLTNLGGYIHTLLYDEGSRLVRFFIANSVMKKPKDMFPHYGDSIDPNNPTPFSFQSKLANNMPEYVLELYILQNKNKLEEIVGSDVSERYNMLRGYQGRYLDIMTVHRDEDGKMLKSTILELKARQLDSSELNRGLDQLSSYMFWVRDQIEKGKISGDVDSVFGVLLAPNPLSSIPSDLQTEIKDHAGQFGIDPNKIKVMGYSYNGTDITISPLT